LSKSDSFVKPFRSHICRISSYFSGPVFGFSLKDKKFLFISYFLYVHMICFVYVVDTLNVKIRILDIPYRKTEHGQYFRFRFAKGFQTRVWRIILLKRILFSHDVVVGFIGGKPSIFPNIPIRVNLDYDNVREQQKQTKNRNLTPLDNSLLGMGIDLFAFVCPCPVYTTNAWMRPTKTIVVVVVVVVVDNRQFLYCD